MMVAGYDVRRLIRWHMEIAQNLRRGAPDRSDYLEIDQLASDHESTAHLLALVLVRANGNGKNGNGNHHRPLKPYANCPSCGSPPNQWAYQTLIDCVKHLPPDTPIVNHKCQRCATMFDIDVRALTGE